jgi:hypothetical protein
MIPPLKNAILAIGAAVAGVLFLATGDEGYWAGGFAVGTVLIALAVYGCGPIPQINEKILLFETGSGPLRLPPQLERPGMSGEPSAPRSYAGLASA